MSALEDRLRRFAYEWHEAMNSPYAVNMMPLLLEAASDIRSLAAPSLEAENAKLRMFIDLKETCWKYVGWCDECPYNGVDDEHDDCNCTMQERINSLARELGVAVE